MKGYAAELEIPKRDLANVEPMRFHLIVRLVDERPKSETVIMIEKGKAKDHTRGWVAEVLAMGEKALDSSHAEGVVIPGATIMFDESVSVDDANRCFDWDGRCVMLDIETVMGVRREDLGWQILGDRVLVRLPEVQEEVNLSNRRLIIPEMYRKRRTGGMVVSAGPGLPKKSGEGHLPMDFKQGDYVLFPAFGGTDIILDGKPFAVIRQDKILARVLGAI